MSVVGVDACRRGWVAVELAAGDVVAAHFLPSIDAVVDACPRAEVVAIDIPIGLPVSGRRTADEAAKAALGPRQNSVFFTPPRAALVAESHAEGTARAVERYRVLSSVGIFLEDLSGRAALAASVDDLLDAGAAAWSAERFRRGEAHSLPARPPVDADGRPVAIWV